MKAKGIDDALVANVQVKSLRGDEAKKVVKELQDQFDIKQEKENDKPSYYELAQAFLVDTEMKVIYFRQSFYLYNQNRYLEVTDDRIKAKILKWTHSIKGLWKSSKNTFQNELLVQLKAICLVDGIAEPPFQIECSDNELIAKKEERYKLQMLNGILDVLGFLNGNIDCLLELSPYYFSTSNAGYDFDPNSNKPKVFFEYLNKVQPNQDIQKLLQEWLGLNLIYDTSFEKMMFFIGEGANGKSVFLLIMKLVLGFDNVSTVDLEGFKPTNRFALANSFMKRANIVGDLNEIDKVGEGVVKQYVSGEEMQVERKHKDPFMMKPTARLTYSMNVLPRFYDRSNGIWRRLLLVPWDNVIPKDERNTNYLKKEFWIESGELPGILNWALVGLNRLITNNRFTEPKDCEELLGQYKVDSNPAKAFLVDHVVEDKGKELSDNDLYMKYRYYMEDEGQKPLSKGNFSKEVKRIFRLAEKSEHARRVDGKRCRVWYNIRLAN